MTRVLAAAGARRRAALLAPRPAAAHTTSARRRSCSSARPSAAASSSASRPRSTSCASAGSATAASPATARGSRRSSARQARIAVDRAERGTLGARYKTAHDIVEDLLASRGFREGAAKLGDTEAVIDEAREYLTEMASVQNRFARDVWAQMSKLLWGRAYGSRSTRPALERLRELNQRYPLVFLPSHKSNMDGFVMSSVTYENGFPANHIVGGINMGFWPLGPLGRRVGVVWIRRSFGGNEVYKYTLRRYLAHLASKRFNLEWYIEGGRSRTGKLLPPKMGLLNYLAKGVEEAGVEEVMLVPVSIVYDRLNELAETTSQMRGAKKRPEGTRWLIRYARSQRGDLGRVQVRFGEPVPLRESLADGDPNALSKVAFEVCTRINRATPVTPISLATLALLGTDGRAMTLAEAQGGDRAGARVRASERGLPGSEELDTDDRADARHARRARRRRALRRRRRAGLPDPRRPRPRGRLLPQRRSSTGSSTARSPSSRWRPARTWRTRCSRRSGCATCSSSSSSSRASGSSATSCARSTRCWRSARRFADRVLRSFLEAYWVVADRLCAHGDAPVDPDDDRQGVPRRRAPVPPAGPDQERRGGVERAVQDRA